MFNDIENHDRSTITVEIGKGGEGMTPSAIFRYAVEAQLPTNHPLARGRRVRRVYSREDFALLDEYSLRREGYNVTIRRTTESLLAASGEDTMLSQIDTN